MTRRAGVPRILSFLVLSFLVACGGGQTVPPADTGGEAKDIQVDAGVDTAEPDVPASPCEGAPEGSACDDDDPCTLDDSCTGGLCVGGANDPCESDNPCQVGSCVSGEGCKYEDLEDGSECTANCFDVATCDSGECTIDPDSAVVCPTPDADENPCLDSLECDTSTGECSVAVHVPSGTICDTDSDLCSKESCDEDGVCVESGSVETCDDEQAEAPCEDWTCNDKTGECVSSGFVGPISCDDGKPCTINDVCQQDEFSYSFCKGDVIPVGDGNSCTNDYCKEGLVFHDVVAGAQCDTGDPCVPIGSCSDVGVCKYEGGCKCDTDLDCAQPVNKCLGAYYCDLSGDVGQCKIDKETIVACPAGKNPCSVTECIPQTGQCADVAVEDEVPCDDSNYCTLNTKCKGGLCGGGAEIGCDDGVFCNGEETCDPIEGCKAGIPVAIDDGIDCTTDACDEVANTVVHQPSNVACDDGLFCNGAELCDAVDGCGPGDTPVIDDDIPCTFDKCDEEQDKIVHEAVNADCDDGLTCNGTEKCQLGVGCVNAAPVDLDDGVDCTVDSCDQDANKVIHEPNSVLCDDDNYCNGEEVCDSKKGCQAGTKVEVDDGIACTTDSCDEVAESVVNEPSNAACDDGLFCNGAEICDADDGCEPGDAPTVDDGIACTFDECDEDKDEIEHDVQDDQCDDGLVCNGTEKCQLGVGCVNAAPAAVDDGIDCTIDSCDADANKVLHEPNDALCDDDVLCNGAEQCNAVLGCEAGSDPAVDDGVACTNDYCDEDTDSIVNEPDHDTCQDGAFCNGKEVCDLVDGCVGSDVGLNLSDGIDCTVDSCDEEFDLINHAPNNAVCDNGEACDGDEFCAADQGCKSSAPPAIDDGIDCTLDTCDAQGNGVHTPNDALCSDGQFCNGEEICDVNQGCKAGSSPDLADAFDCTIDSCDEQDDLIIHAPNQADCDDGFLCNGIEECDPAQGCTGGGPIDLDDGIDCTVDTCDQLLGVVTHVPNHADCDDNEVCNGQEICNPNIGCTFGAPPELDDGIECTIDFCDPGANQVVHQANDGACNNGIHCDGDETCDALEGCQPGVPVAIDDGIDCTDDSCDEEQGPVNQVNHAVCDNLDFCDGVEICDKNVGCLVGPPIDVDDGVACTTDLCDPVTGTLIHEPNDAECVDELFCNGTEFCDPNVGCAPGAPPAVEDGVECTADFCDEAHNKVVHTALDEDCDDFNVCNGQESCDLIQGCVEGPPPILDDNISCTVDSCDVNEGVAHTVDHSLCDNNDFCDGVEVCSIVNGGCELGEPPDPSDGIACTVDICVDGAFSHVADDEYCAAQPGAGGLCTVSICDELDQPSCVEAAVPNCCGNGVIEEGESCDDQNVKPGDGCSGKCQVETPVLLGTVPLADVVNLIEGENAKDYAGTSVAGGGDINGDGFDDIIIGAPGHDANGSNAGAAYVFYGPIFGQLKAGEADAIFRGATAGDNAGHSVAIAGDLNKDGFDDILVGAPYSDINGSNNGAAYVIFGHSKLAGTFTLEPNPAEGIYAFHGHKQDSNNKFGWSVAGVGDVTGDTVDDFAVGERDLNGYGAVFLVVSNNFIEGGNTTLDPQMYGYRFMGMPGSGRLGDALDGAGNFSGKKHDHFIMGYPGFTGCFKDPNGKCFYYGGGAVADSEGMEGFGYKLPITESEWVIYSVKQNSNLGRSVSGLGDIDGDGYDDVLLGGDTFNFLENEYEYKGSIDASGIQNAFHGFAVIQYGGQKSGALSSGDGSNTRRFIGEYEKGQFGFSVAGLGDINGDGHPDMAVGGIGTILNQGTAPYVSIWYGPISADPDAWYSSSIAHATLTHPPGTWAGYAISGAGDLNNDGFDDFLVSAPHDGPWADSDYGRVYVLYGGNLGCPEGQVLAGQIASWCGKVNVHTDQSGWWVNDDDCSSGCEKSNLDYCQKLYPGSKAIINLSPTSELKPFMTAGCTKSYLHPGQKQYGCCVPK